MSYFIRRLLIFPMLLLVATQVLAEHDAKKTGGHSSQNAKQKLDAQYVRQNAAIIEAYRKLEKKITRQWGSETIIPSAKRDVIYRDNLRQRSVIDYEDGVVKVELLIARDKANNTLAVEQQLAKAIEKTVLQTADTRTISEVAKTPEPNKTHGPPLLAGLLANNEGKAFTKDELQDFMLRKSRSPMMQALTGGDGQQRMLVSAELKMVPDHIRVRAQRFSASVSRYAEALNIPAEMIYAIIETESSFNPKARSPVPAFGLMQLVPSTGARDAYHFLYTKDRIVKERYLYVADKNIELGTAYLHILYFKKFKRINNPESRRWATIAAYNTGSDNVVRAFSGKYSKRKFASRYFWRRQALKKINRMKPENVYRHLRKHLPAKETRGYIKKIRKRMKKYSA
ncbi:MAG: DUF3393 domain-containing protein [Gammaproteobacteria bacterium]|nr:DUF3393 domain-containing protein [Gammaproteobacteria bacterium]